MIPPPLDSNNDSNPPEPTGQFFNFTPDSIAPALNVAIDTLQTRNTSNPFTNKFIAEWGIPAWDYTRMVSQNGWQVMLVPVIRPDREAVSGIWSIALGQNRLGSHWIPRGHENAPEALETIMAGMQQRIFVQAAPPELSVTVRKKPDAADSSGVPNIVSDMGQIDDDYDADAYCHDPFPCGNNNYTTVEPCDENEPDIQVCINDGGGGGGTGGGGGSGGSGDGNDDTDTGDGDTGGDENIITYNPEVKYPPGSDYAQRYPKLTEYLRNQLPTLKDNQTIIDAIQTYTPLTEEEIAQDLQFGQGPTIRIEQLGKSNNGGEIYGEFRENTDPNSLYLDIDLVNDLENTSPGSQLADAFSFLVGVTVLHEFVHFGDTVDGVDYPGEEGTLFENDVYGQTVSRNNAGNILLQR